MSHNYRPIQEPDDSKCFVFANAKIDEHSPRRFFGRGWHPGRVTGEGLYNNGTEVTLRAFPEPHFEFFRWVRDVTIDGVATIVPLSNEPVLTITVEDGQDYRISAEFSYDRDYSDFDMDRGPQEFVRDTTVKDEKVQEPTEPSEGEYSINVSVIDANGEAPLPNAVIGVYNDEGLTDFVVGSQLDEMGMATVMLDAGTYWFIGNKAGYSLTSKEVVVEGNMSVTIELESEED